MLKCDRFILNEFDKKKNVWTLTAGGETEHDCQFSITILHPSYLHVLAVGWVGRAAIANEAVNKTQGG